METELGDLEDKVQDMWDYQINPDYIQHELVHLEDRSRLNNLRIDGTEEEERNTGRYPKQKRPKNSKTSWELKKI